MQLQIDNRDRKLKAGGYAQATLNLPATRQVARIPSSALVNDQHGVHVAMIGPDGKVAFRPVTVARDMGPTIDIASGIVPGDKVIDSPPDDLNAGDVVRAARRPGRQGQWLGFPAFPCWRACSWRAAPSRRPTPRRPWRRPSPSRKRAR